jgi:hypothetical protein
MSYSLMDPQPAARAENATDTDPGLYPDEVAVTLDDGSHVAVACAVDRMANGQGVEFRATARAITADGTSQICGSGYAIQTTWPQLCPPESFARFGVDALRKEHILGVLGEPPTQVALLDSDGNPVMEADGVTPKTVPMCGTVDPTAADQISVRHAMAVATAMSNASALGAIL